MKLFVFLYKQELQFKIFEVSQTGTKRRKTGRKKIRTEGFSVPSDKSENISCTVRGTMYLTLSSSLILNRYSIKTHKLVIMVNSRTFVEWRFEVNELENVRPIVRPCY